MSQINREDRAEIERRRILAEIRASMTPDQQVRLPRFRRRDITPAGSAETFRKRSEAHKRAWAAKPAEQRAAVGRRIQAGLKRYWQSLTTAEKARRINDPVRLKRITDRRRRWANALTPEQRAQYGRAIMAGKARRRAERKAKQLEEA